MTKSKPKRKRKTIEQRERELADKLRKCADQAHRIAVEAFASGDLKGAEIKRHWSERIRQIAETPDAIETRSHNGASNVLERPRDE